MERLAERNGVERDAIVAQACADFLRNHKQAKEKAAARFYEYQEEQAKQLWSKL
jgi:ClpP class serine protease